MSVLSVILPLGAALDGYVLIDSKKLRRMFSHSIFFMPWMTRGGLPSLRSWLKSYSEPTAPCFESPAPKTRIGMRASRIAPRHIVHGSSVTHSMVSVSLQLSRLFEASLMAAISA